MQFNGSLMVALYRDKSMDAFSRGRTVDESMCNDQRLKSKHMFLYVDWMYIYIMYVRRTTHDLILYHWGLLPEMVVFNSSKNLVMLFKEGMLFTNSGMQDGCAMGCYKVYLV